MTRSLGKRFLGAGTLGAAAAGVGSEVGAAGAVVEGWGSVPFRESSERMKTGIAAFLAFTFSVSLVSLSISLSRTHTHSCTHAFFSSFFSFYYFQVFFK